MSGWSTSTLAKAILAVIILAVLITILYTYAGGPVKSVTEWALPNNTLTTYSLDTNTEFFTQVFNNYKECKLSPDIDCCCDLNPGLIQRDYTLEIRNENQKTFFQLWQDGVLYDRLEGISPAGQTADASVLHIDRDETYFEEGTPSKTLYISQKQVNRFSSDDPIYKRFGVMLYSGENIEWQDDYKIFNNGKIYKKDTIKTIFLKESEAEEMRKCKLYSNISKANENYEKILSTITSCTKISAENKEVPFCANLHPMNLPEDYEIDIRKNAVELVYTKENKKIRSEILDVNLCLASEEEGKIVKGPDTLKITPKTLKILFYRFDDSSVCLAPKSEIEIQEELLKEEMQSLPKNPSALA